VVYRIPDSGRLEVFGETGAPTVIQGTRLGPDLSRSLFRREQRICKLIVDVPEAALR